MISRYLALLAAIALIVAAPAYPQEGPAQSYPGRPIRVVVGYGAGGGNDIVIRLLAGKMAEGLGQPVLVENKPGAQSIIGAQYVAKAPPDGYTLLMGPTGTMTVNPAIYSKIPYSPLRDFVPISMIGTFPLVLVVAPSSPVKSVSELIEYARARPNNVFYASPSAAFQLASELFNQKTGTRFVTVPYKSSAETAQAVATGQVTMAIVDLAGISGYLKSGTVRGLAVLAAARHPSLPNLPSATELGMPGIEVTIFQGLFAPAGTPAPIVKRLQEEVARVVRLPDIRARLENMGVDPSGSTSDELGRVVASDLAKWTAVAKTANIKAD